MSSPPQNTWTGLAFPTNRARNLRSTRSASTSPSQNRRAASGSYAWWTESSANGMAGSTSTGRARISTWTPRTSSWPITSAWKAATVRGSSATLRRSPSVVRSTRTWSTTSNSISRLRWAACMSDVVSPRAETYSGTCHQWFTAGSRARRTLPTTWVHMWRVSRVSAHVASVNSGQGLGAPGRPGSSCTRSLRRSTMGRDPTGGSDRWRPAPAAGHAIARPTRPARSSPCSDGVDLQRPEARGQRPEARGRSAGGRGAGSAADGADGVAGAVDHGHHWADGQVAEGALGAVRVRVGRGQGFGGAGGDTHPGQLPFVLGPLEQRQDRGLLVVGVLQHGHPQVVEPAREVLVVGSEALELGEQRLGVALLGGAGVDDLVTGGVRVADHGIDDLLLGRLVHGEQAHEALERLAPGIARPALDVGEQPLDLDVLAADQVGDGRLVGTCRLVHGVPRWGSLDVPDAYPRPRVRNAG